MISLRLFFLQKCSKSIHYVASEELDQPFFEKMAGLMASLNLTKWLESPILGVQLPYQYIQNALCLIRF